jgi:hypothetical protein
MVEARILRDVEFNALAIMRGHRNTVSERYGSPRNRERSVGEHRRPRRVSASTSTFNANVGQPDSPRSAIDATPAARHLQRSGGVIT